MIKVVSAILREPAGPLQPFLRKIADEFKEDGQDPANDLANLISPELRVTRIQLFRVMNELFKGKLPADIARRLDKRNTDPHLLDYFRKPTVNAGKLLIALSAESFNHRDITTAQLANAVAGALPESTFLTPWQARLLRHEVRKGHSTEKITAWVNKLQEPL